MRTAEVVLKEMEQRAEGELRRSIEWIDREIADKHAGQPGPFSSFAQLEQIRADYQRQLVQLQRSR